MQNEPIEVTFRVTQVLERLNIPYLIGGSLASTLYGMVRTTQNAGMVAKMQIEHLRPFVLALQNEFYLDDEKIAESIQHYSRFNIIHRDSMFKVDVFIPYPRPFLQSALARAQKQSFFLKKKYAQNLAASKILSWINSSGIVSAAGCRSVNGVILLVC